MRIYDGSKLDKFNIESLSYVQINSCGLSTAKDDFISYRKNGRVDYHILYVDEGECKVLYDGKEYGLKSGNFVFYPPKMTQKYTHLKGTKTIWLHFNGFCIEEIIKQANLKFGVTFSSHSLTIKNTLINLISKYNQKNSVPEEKPTLISLIYTLGKIQNNINSIDEKLNSCISFITENHSLNFTTCDLAKICNVSPSRFMHIFKEATGSSPHAYQQSLRINNCKTLLLETNLKISDIAYQAGYDDPLYFSRIFKKITGVSPKDYRKNKLFNE
ncbi:MAG: AraC family transcriptional regulator [Ruminococcaceae bacterium]|nr:AraC family transcriptional regulator [Oscillospiraceae bacterium]